MVYTNFSFYDLTEQWFLRTIPNRKSLRINHVYWCLRKVRLEPWMLYTQEPAVSERPTGWGFVSEAKLLKLSSYGVW